MIRFRASPLKMKRSESILPCLLISLTLLGWSVSPACSETEPPADLKKFHIFLLAGQSNMAGRATIEPQDKGEIPGTLLWNIAEQKWEPATAPFNRYSPNRKAMNMQRLNCGPSFAKAYRKAHPGITVGIVCAVRGGTTIEQWAKGVKKPFPLYDDALAATVAALAAGGELKGILWHQGEGNSGKPDGYPEKLAELVANFRQDLENPELPFVFGQIGQWKPEYAAFNAMIVEQPGTIAMTACVRTDGLTNMDQAHFDSKSQRTLGERYAEAILALNQ